MLGSGGGCQRNLLSGCVQVSNILDTLPGLFEEPLRLEFAFSTLPPWKAF